MTSVFKLHESFEMTARIHPWKNEQNPIWNLGVMKIDATTHFLKISYLG